MSPPGTDPVFYCHICPNASTEVRLMVLARGIPICDECIELMTRIVRERTRGSDWERLKDFAP